MVENSVSCQGCRRYLAVAPVHGQCVLRSYVLNQQSATLPSCHGFGATGLHTTSCPRPDHYCVARWPKYSNSAAPAGHVLGCRFYSSISRAKAGMQDVLAANKSIDISTTAERFLISWTVCRPRISKALPCCANPEPQSSRAPKWKGPNP